MPSLVLTLDYRDWRQTARHFLQQVSFSTGGRCSAQSTKVAQCWIVVKLYRLRRLASKLSSPESFALPCRGGEPSWSALKKFQPKQKKHRWADGRLAVIASAVNW